MLFVRVEQGTLNLALPDDQVHAANSTLTVAAAGTITGIRVHIAMAHTYWNDVEIRLFHPSGASVELEPGLDLHQCGGSGIDITYMDGSPNPWSRMSSGTPSDCLVRARPLPPPPRCPPVCSP
jgi:hypothetical protein